MKKEKYQIIYADPPWKYKQGKSMGTHFQGAADAQYPCMDYRDIGKLPVKELADEKCILFIWVTFPMLAEGLEVIKAWGFEYKTIAFSWVKINPVNKQPLFGIGYYTKSNVEVCLLATKGEAHKLVKNNSISQVIVAPRTKHSKKPDEIREKIVQLVGDVPRIELFARDNGSRNLFNKNPLDGWSAWGNEVENDIILTP